MSVYARIDTPNHQIKPNITFKRPQKYPIGKKLRLKNEHGIYEYDVSIVSARYDDQQHKWMYTLEDYKLDPIEGEKPENALG